MITATITGYLGKKPELRDTKSGKAMATFSLASTTRREGRDPHTTWIDCVAFDEMAEGVSGNLDKGSRVVVTGELEVEAFTRKDGSAGQSLRMVVREVGLSVKPRAMRDDSDEVDSRHGESRSRPERQKASRDLW